MAAMDARNMYSNLAVNKYLHTVASRWISSTSLLEVQFCVTWGYITHQIMWENVCVWNHTLYHYIRLVKPRPSALKTPFIIEVLSWNTTFIIEVVVLNNTLCQKL